MLPDFAYLVRDRQRLWDDQLTQIQRYIWLRVWFIFEPSSSIAWAVAAGSWKATLFSFISLLYGVRFWASTYMLQNAAL